jgi:hypothetical protein
MSEYGILDVAESQPLYPDNNTNTLRNTKSGCWKRLKPNKDLGI